MTPLSAAINTGNSGCYFRLRRAGLWDLDTGHVGCHPYAQIIVNIMVNDSLGAVLEALADPSRRQIVERLVRGPAPVSELARPLAMSLPAVMRHLAVLESCGLVRSEKLGRVRMCHVETQQLRALEHWAATQRTAWENRLDQLRSYLDASTDDAPLLKKKGNGCE